MLPIYVKFYVIHLSTRQLNFSRIWLLYVYGEMDSNHLNVITIIKALLTLLKAVQSPLIRICHRCAWLSDMTAFSQ